MANWTAADILAQTGKLAVVTGPTGLGYEIGLALARAGAEVVLAGRNVQTGEASVARVRSMAAGGAVRFEALDLASLGSVKAFADRLLAAGRPVDILVNNAGVMMVPERRTTADGFELQLGTNYLGHFALTGRLRPLLAAARARVVSVSSISANPGRIHFDDLQLVRTYNPSRAYEQSKLAMILFAYELQRQSAANGWGISSLAAHPGVAATDLIDKGPGASSLMSVATRVLPFLRQPAAQGALPILYAATSPEAVGGGYYGPDGFQQMRGYPRKIAGPPQSHDASVAQRLWTVSEQLTDVRFGGGD
jgi:NAD(P)-dependent dehydrogenase (short-subunit alcohol dehydrogenase family)